MYQFIGGRWARAYETTGNVDLFLVNLHCLVQLSITFSKQSVTENALRRSMSTKTHHTVCTTWPLAGVREQVKWIVHLFLVKFAVWFNLRSYNNILRSTHCMYPSSMMVDSYSSDDQQYWLVSCEIFEFGSTWSLNNINIGSAYADYGPPPLLVPYWPWLRFINPTTDLRQTTSIPSVIPTTDSDQTTTRDLANLPILLFNLVLKRGFS